MRDVSKVLVATDTSCDDAHVWVDLIGRKKKQASAKVIASSLATSYDRTGAGRSLWRGHAGGAAMQRHCNKQVRLVSRGQRNQWRRPFESVAVVAVVMPMPTRRKGRSSVERRHTEVRFRRGRRDDSRAKAAGGVEPPRLLVVGCDSKDTTMRPKAVPYPDRRRLASCCHRRLLLSSASVARCCGSVAALLCRALPLDAHRILLRRSCLLIQNPA